MIAELHKVRYADPFNAVLVNPLSVSLPVTSEQTDIIKEILEICCSDTQFADKAYRAINHILTVGPTVPAAVTSLNPATVVLGSPDFDIHVIGTGFTPTSVIIFNGFEEPTTFISASEVSTGVNMSVWAAPAVVPVAVSNDGVLSESMDFEFTAVVGTLSVGGKKVAEHKVEEHKKDVMKEHIVKDDHPLNPLKK